MYRKNKNIAFNIFHLDNTNRHQKKCKNKFFCTDGDKFLNKHWILNSLAVFHRYSCLCQLFTSP